MRYIKTAAGQQAFKERQPVFSARQRSLFILVDGVKAVDQLLADARGRGVVKADIEHLVAQGLLAPAPQPIDLPVAEPPAVEAAPLSSLTTQARYLAARAMATQLTATLGLRGLLLNMAVESAAGYDDLLALFPKIRAAVGRDQTRELELTLKG